MRSSEASSSLNLVLRVGRRVGRGRAGAYPFEACRVCAEQCEHVTVGQVHTLQPHPLGVRRGLL